MKDKLILIEKYVFYGFLGLFGISLLSLFFFSFSDSFNAFSLAFDYLVMNLFRGGTYKVIFTILSAITIIFFIIIWIINSKRMKRYSFGPLYLFSFFLLFLFSNGYYNALFHPNFPFVMLIITIIYSFLSTIYCLVVYLLTISFKEASLDE